MTAQPPADEERDFYLRTRWAWHALSAAIVVLAGVFLLVDGRPGQLLWLGLLSLAYTATYVWPAGCHWSAGPATAGKPVAIGVVYLATAYAVVGALAWADPNTLVLLFVLFPQTFLTLRLRWAVVATCVLSAVYTLALVGRSGWSPQALRMEGFGGAVGAVFAVAIGAFITGLVRQGEQRRQLITELRAANRQRDDAQRAADVAAERERLAREIHDSLAQGFTSVVMLAQAAEASLAAEDREATRRRLGQIDAAARDGLAEARALVATMQPVALHDQTLDAALERLVERFESETGVTARFEADGAPATLRPASEDVVLLRAAQEALANVRNHAEATAATVRLTTGAGTTTLEVVDDGRGFDPSAPSAGFGLRGMRARAEEAGGAVTITSGAGGTTVRVTVGSAEVEAGVPTSSGVGR